MRVASLVKKQYKGEILTERQWLIKGYKPKVGAIPEPMWANTRSCYSEDLSKAQFFYYYDYQVEKITEV